ncbi:MAG: cupredoxin domain-containing protein [Chloroflexia bacterium]|nr:cupredoxin domain-containing protein [Chloroflexia bacterium]
MKGRIGVVAFVVLLAVGVAPPASAGGWATVELDAWPAKVVAGKPLTIGFQVLQHGEQPVAGALPRLTATHRTSGERLHADGTADGAAGHYRVTVTFPVAGAWKWSIASSSAPSVTAFEALDVALPPLAAKPERASIWKDRSHYPGRGAGIAAPSAKSTVKITIHDGGFAPARVEIPRGATVEWSNTGIMPHQVMGTDLAFDDSNLLRTNETFTRSLNEPGTYTYLCGPHQAMIGTIVVT